MVVIAIVSLIARFYFPITRVARGIFLTTQREPVISNRITSKITASAAAATAKFSVSHRDFADEFNGDKLDTTKWSNSYRWAEMQGMAPNREITN